MAPTRRQASVFPYRGKWRVQYLDTFGRARTLTAESRQDAYLKLADVEGQIRQGFIKPQSKEMPSFGQWLDYWLGKRRAELNPTTYWGYESTIRIWIKPAMGHLRLDTVTARQLQDFYHFLQESHGLANGTIRRTHSLLSGCFSFALKQGLLTHSPISGVVKPRLERKPIEVFTRGEVTELLQIAKQKGPKAELRWILALRYGMRQGEVLGLKFSDFDVLNRTLKIERTVNSLPGKGVVELPTKSKHSKRLLPIDSHLIQLYSQLQTSQDWVFKGEDAMPIEATTDQRHWRALLLSAGVRYLPLHSARHTVATLLMQEGVNPRALQILLGHSSPAYTLATYVHPDLNQLRPLIADNSERGELGFRGTWEIGLNNR
jgi:integrase